MHKLISATVIAFATQAFSAQNYLNPGDTCVSIAGPPPIPCRPDHLCCPVHVNLASCYDGESCPSSLAEEGELCSGIAGPYPNPCNPDPQ